MKSHNAPLSTYKMTISYDGRGYFGWQRHGDKPTIQFAMEQAVDKVFGLRVPVRSAGRTDRGTHANGQVVSVELPLGAELQGIRNSLNDMLPADIRVVEVAKAPLGFHVRESAIAKRYRYVIWNDINLPTDRDGRVWHVRTPLDVQAMIDVCPDFVGTLNFASFATRSNFTYKSTTRTVSSMEIGLEMPVITIDICADGFLYKMVRNIIRTLVKVGEGRYSREDISRILKARDRKAAPGAAPASGLYLERVFYSPEELCKDRQEQSDS